MNFSTRVTELLGIRYPIIQAGMSWASSNPELALAVSQAGGLGMIGAGPMYPDALRAAIRSVKARTDKPFAVNVPLYNPRAAAFLDIVLEERVPILVASQGGPKQHIARFKEHGVTWLHVTASPEHAVKAEAAGVDAVIVVGTEAGGHPPPDEVGGLVVVRAVVKAVSLPVIAGGGIADGAGIAAMFCLGAEGVQLGTRFLLTPESSLHQAYKARALAAGISDTTLVGRGKLPVRALKNEFTRAFEAAERAGMPAEELAALGASRTLKMAALDGDVEQGKVELGQSVGLIDELLPAAEVVARLVTEFEAARRAALAVSQLSVRHRMSELLIENRGAVRILTMNRPDKRNALNFALTEALLAGLRAADTDAERGQHRAHRRRSGLLRRRRPLRVQGPDPGQRGAGRAPRRADEGAPRRLLAPVEAGGHRRQRRRHGRRRRTGARRRRGGDGRDRQARLSGGEARHRGGDRDGQSGAQCRAQGRVRAARHRRAGRRRARVGARHGQSRDHARRADAGGAALAEKFAAVDACRHGATKQLFYSVLDLPFEAALDAGRDVNKRMRAFGKR